MEIKCFNTFLCYPRFESGITCFTYILLLLLFFFKSRFVTLYGFYQIKIHTLIQDNVFHIFTLTTPSNDTWECLFCTVCAFQLLTYYAMIKC